VPIHTVFGDDNRKAIGLQINVLEDRLDEEDVWKMGKQDDWTRHEKDSALEAALWLCGEREQLADDPEGWLSIVK
jgi:hypothetical protein